MDQPENELRVYIQDKGKPMWTTHNNHNLRYFKEEEIRIITSNYNTPIGKGAFGEVYKGLLDDNSPVAVKRYIHNEKENFAKEVIVHHHINHRNVVRLIGYCIGEDALMMVTEYISKGNLSDNLHCSKSFISLETRLGIAIGCAEALSYMHSQMYDQVIHGDIKPANILLDENLNPKISDFGISRLLSTDNDTLRTSIVVGSIGYMDPLFAQTGKLTPKSDVYSFGVVLLELITRRKAIDDSKVSLVEKFTQALAKRKKIREFYDVKVADDNNLKILDEIGKLAEKCLAMDIKKRPEMKYVEEHLRKAQYQLQEKTVSFGWVWRSKQPPQNMVRTDKMDPTPVLDKHLHGNQVLKAKAQAQKVGEVDIDVHSIKTSREGSPKNHGFGSLEKTELDVLLRGDPEVLGKGSYGTTYKVTLETGAVLTLKRWRPTDVPEAVFEERIAAIGAIEHELIVPLRRYYFSKDEKLLVYDYLPNGDLFSRLHGNIFYMTNSNPGRDKAPLDWETLSAIALSVARAVAYIHSTNPAASHGNIHSCNILLTGSHEARLSEHGLKTLGIASTPTLVTNNDIAQKDDVYSFGVVLLEMVSGKLPEGFMGGSIREHGINLLRWVVSLTQEEWAEVVFDERLLIKSSVAEEMVQFLKLAFHCCATKPSLRPAMSEVVRQIEEIRGSGDRLSTGSNTEAEEHTVSQGT